MKFYEIINGILLKNKPKSFFLNDPGFDKVMSGFMLARYISMHPKLLAHARVINHINKAGLSDIQMFHYAYDHIPKQKSGYIQYMKKTKKDKK